MSTPELVEAALKDVADRAHKEVPGFESEAAILAAEVRRLREQAELDQTTAAENTQRDCLELAQLRADLAAREAEIGRISTVDIPRIYEENKSALIRETLALCQRAETAEALVVEKDKALSAIIPMLREWHDDFPRHVGDKESWALKDADIALTLTPSGITSRISKLEADLAARDATIAGLVALLGSAREYVATCNADCPRGTDDERDELVDRLDAAKSAAPVSQELAELRETLLAIKAVNVNEFGGVADYAINRLICSCSALNTARKEGGK